MQKRNDNGSSTNNDSIVKKLLSSNGNINDNRVEAQGKQYQMALQVQGVISYGNLSGSSWRN